MFYVDSWGKFVLTVPHPVHVTLRITDIDDGTVRRIQTSPDFTVTEDKEGGNSGKYDMFQLTT